MTYVSMSFFMKEDAVKLEMQTGKMTVKIKPQLTFIF